MACRHPYPMDDIVQRDEAGDDTGAFTQNPWVRRVDDRNEPTLRSGCWRPVRLYAGPPGAREGNKDYWVPLWSPPLYLPVTGDHESTPLRPKMSLQSESDCEAP